MSYHQDYYKKNKEAIKQKSLTYYNKNKDEINKKRSEYFENYRKNNKEKSSKYYSENKEKLKEYYKEYRKNNKSLLKEKLDIRRNLRNERLKKRYKNDIIYKIKISISRSIYKNLKSNKNNISTISKLPYSIQELKQYLESKFESWMTWDNWGVYKHNTWDDNNKATWTWQIDHIISHSTFQYKTMDDESFKTCWELSNLRPYSAKQNVLDGARKVSYVG